MDIGRTLAKLCERYPPRTPEQTARWFAFLDLLERYRATFQDPTDRVQLDLFSPPVYDVDARSRRTGVKSRGVRDAPPMRHGHHTRRHRPDPLAPIDQPTWLVVRDGLNTALAATELAPGADLRAVLEAARSERIAAGWKAEPIGQCVSFVFATRDGERVMVSIEHRPPGSGLGAW